MPNGKRTYVENVTRRGASLQPLRVRLLDGFGVSVGSRSIAQDAWRLRSRRPLSSCSPWLPATACTGSRRWTCSGPTRAGGRLPTTCAAYFTPPARYSTRPRFPLPRERGQVACAVSGSRPVGRRGCFRGGIGDRPSHQGARGLQGGPRPVRGRALARGSLRTLGGGQEVGAPAGLYSRRISNSPACTRSAGNTNGVSRRCRGSSEEPADEEAQVCLMRLYAYSGRRQEALSRYERSRGLLRAGSVRSLATRPADCATR